MALTVQKLILTITPDPFISFIKVKIHATCTELGFLNIYNQYGQAVYRTTLDLVEGTNEIEIVLEDIPVGSYYVHYKTSISKAFVMNKVEKVIATDTIR